MVTDAVSAARMRAVLLAVFCILFWVAAGKLNSMPRHVVAREIEILLPVWVQVLMAGGERNLAANIAAIRGLVVATEKLRPEEYEFLARVQQDVSWLNPAHEDNYYAAAAILPWSGQLDAAQLILARATAARPFDYQPAFLYAFHLYHFKGDSIGAAKWLRDAAEKLPDDDNKLVMQNLAARWVDKASNLELAIQVVEALAKQTGRRDFRRYLETRVERLRMLQSLREAAKRFSILRGRAPDTLDELVSSGVIDKLPADPFGIGFAIDATGEVVMKAY